MFSNKIGERGRAKFTIQSSGYSNRYRFYVESPQFNSASSVEGYIWEEGANPNESNSRYLHPFKKYNYSSIKYVDNDSRYTDGIYVYKNNLYHFHVYYYYSSTKIYLDEIAFRI